jgi:ABC-type antimicrobial peptide transport system permease subunit
VNPSVPFAHASTLDVFYQRSMSRTSFTLAILGIAGAMALLLGVCGIYGVIGYAVAQRRREIGIRLALGAQQRQVRALFLRRGLFVTGAGVSLGLVAAVAFSQLLQSLLFGVEPLDPASFIAMPIVLATAALLGAYLPARKAVAVDPVETMKAE